MWFSYCFNRPIYYIVTFSEWMPLPAPSLPAAAAAWSRMAWGDVLFVKSVRSECHVSLMRISVDVRLRLSAKSSNCHSLSDHSFVTGPDASYAYTAGTAGKYEGEYTVQMSHLTDIHAHRLLVPLYPVSLLSLSIALSRFHCSLNNCLIKKSFRP